MLIVPALLIIVGGYYWLTSGGSVSTDDAQVKQDIVSVSPQVNGQVVAGVRPQRRAGEAGRHPVPDRPAALPGRARAGAGAAASGRAADDVLQTPAAGTGGDITGAQANLAIKRNALGAAAGAAQAGLHDARRL